MATKNTSATAPEQIQIAVVSVDKSDREILQLNTDPGFQMEWDPDDFRPLPEEIWTQLTPKNIASYSRAKALFDNARLQKRSKNNRVLVNPMNPIEGDSEARLRIRKRPGWHQCWKNPGREYEAAIAGRYVPVKKLGEKQDKASVKPGNEDGEILKLFTSDGAVEQIAVECPEEVYQEYLQYMSEASLARTGSVPEEFAGGIEQINRTIGKPNTRIEALDGQGRPLL
jgi:hypothetical protein